jgi:protein-export membrane protein SecD
MSKTSLPSKKTVRYRVLWLAVLFIVVGSLSYPTPANWVLAQLKNITSLNLGQIEKPFVLGLDLQGGTHLEYEADLANVPEADRTDAISGVRDVIERRVNAMGVSEPLVQTTQAGTSWRVTVELAGVKDINQAIKMIGETPILEFKEQNDVTTQPLTPEQKKQMETENAAQKKQAEAFLAAARKPGAEFEKITTTTDHGFVVDKPELSDLLAAVKDVATGTVMGKVLERPNTYSVVRLAEKKDAGTEVNARHILIAYKGAQGELSTLTKEEAKKLADELKGKATKENFEELAAKNSHEPGAVESKGDLGWFAKGQMVDAFEKAVFSQAVGTISDIVETPFGYHLVYKMGERPRTDYRVVTLDVKRTTERDLAPPADPWKTTKLTGKQLSSAKVEFDQRTGQIMVSLQFNDEGGKLFAEITKKNIGKPVAIFLDGEPISTPVVQSEILGGQAVISGNFTINEAKILARRLQAGALPVPIKLIAQQTVGPTLGADSLEASLKAGLIGFLLVAVFMILLYRLPGVLSILALALYAALVAALFKMIPVTLTLSGIAGFILSIGIAVDANVLVFERLKEELKEGKGIPQALEDAFRRAWPSIRDGHVTVLISCAVLYWFSSSIIRGFALTLALGTITSLFTAVVSCRTMLRFTAATSMAKFGWLFLKK